MRAGRAVVSAVVGAVAGLSVAGLVGIPQLAGPANIGAFISNAFTFWGLFFGAFAGVVGAGIAFAILSRRDRRSSPWGRRIAGLALGVLGVGTTLWIASWGLSPLTLEGLWIYPLAIGAMISSIFLLRRPRPGAWDESPKATAADG